MVINVMPAKNGVKQKTRKKLTDEFYFLLKIWFLEKDDFIKNDVTPNWLFIKRTKLWKSINLIEINRR